MMMLECDAKRLLASVGVNAPAGTVWRRGEAAAGRLTATIARYTVTWSSGIACGFFITGWKWVAFAVAAAIVAAIVLAWFQNRRR